MAKDPTIPFYASDFYMDTIQMDERLIGAYTRLLCTLWINKVCHYSAIALANVSPSAKEVVDLIKDKFTFYENGTFSSNRLEEERTKRLENREKRKKAGSLGGKSKWQTDSKSHSKTMTKEDEKEKENEKESDSENSSVLGNGKTEYFLAIYNKFLPPELQQDWCAYLDYCYERGDIRLNRSTVTAQVKFLQENIQDAKKMMRESIRNNWKGLFKSKEDKIGFKTTKPSKGSVDLEKYERLLKQEPVI